MGESIKKFLKKQGRKEKVRERKKGREKQGEKKNFHFLILSLKKDFQEFH